MKATKLFAIFAMALMMVSMPSQAQSRKERKAAEKAAWEARQQFIKDSTEIANKQRLDEMKKAPQEAADAKAKAEAAKAKREAEQAKRAEEEKIIKQQTTLVDVPCWLPDDSLWYAATSSRKFTSKNENTVARALLRSCQQQLFDKLKKEVKEVIDDYADQMDTEEISYEREHIESKALSVIRLMVNETNENCRKKSLYKDEDGLYTMYMSIKISKQLIVDKVTKSLIADEEIKVRDNEEKMRHSFEKVFNDENS